jgi:hypothetical protein
MEKKYKIDLCIGIAIALVAACLTVVIPRILNPKPKIDVTLFEPIPNPENDGKIQFLVIENVGSCVSDISVMIEYQQIRKEMPDYRIKSVASIREEVRSATTLKFEAIKLKPKSFVIVVFSISIGEIEPKHVTITHSIREIKEDEIKYVKITHFKEI